MKKFLISLVMMLATFGTALGQKSYVNVVADHIYSSVYQEIYLTGDVPAGKLSAEELMLLKCGVGEDS